MSDTAMVPRKSGGRPAGPVPLINEQLADQLLGKAQSEGVELLGPDGLLSQVTKAVLERALAEEMTGHLGHEKLDPAGRGSGNSRNGMTSKTLLTDVGAVGLAVPRDRNGGFDPKIAREGQTRLEGFNHRVVATRSISSIAFSRWHHASGPRTAGSPPGHGNLSRLPDRPIEPTTSTDGMSGSTRPTSANWPARTSGSPSRSLPASSARSSESSAAKSVPIEPAPTKRMGARYLGIWSLRATERRTQPTLAIEPGRRRRG